MAGDRTGGIMLPNCEQLYLESAQGQQYLVQISWPLHWKEHDPPEDKKLPIIYIVDGNAFFLTATEAAWRRAAESHYAGGGIVVAIGYPLAGTGKVYHRDRRNRDLTPPTPQTPVPGYGGADELLDFIAGVVRPAVRARFPRLSVSREALFGHSYGGLFVLHALFTRPGLFDGYFASSPSIWWNARCILEEARAFLARRGDTEVVPRLVMFLGGLEQNPVRWDDESEDQYEGRKRSAAILRMKDNVLDLVGLLEGTDRLRGVSLSEYPGEDHGTVMACSMSRGLTTFFEEWL